MKEVSEVKDIWVVFKELFSNAKEEKP